MLNDPRPTEAEIAEWMTWLERHPVAAPCRDAAREAACATWRQPDGTGGDDERNCSTRAPWRECGSGSDVLSCHVMLERATVQQRAESIAAEVAYRIAEADAIGIPTIFRGTIGVRTPSRMSPTAAADAVEEFGRSRGILALGGQTGTGKSTAAAAWLWRWHRHAVVDADGVAAPSVFVTAASVRRADWYDNEAVRRILSAPALVIDDLGAEMGDSASRTWVARLDEIVTERHAQERPTVITTNLPEAAFWQLVGDRAEDRVVHVGRYVACTGRSLRRDQPKPRATT